MIDSAFSTIAGYIASIGLDSAKKQFDKKIDEKKLHSELMSYVERQKKYNEISLLVEEIDFEGLTNYIRSNLIDNVSVRIFDVDRKKRELARIAIINSAIAFSNAQNKEAKARVSKIVADCLDIIRDFYKNKHLSFKEYLLAETIVDPIVSAIDDSTNKMLNKLDAVDSLFSIDKAVSLSKGGDYKSIEAGINTVVDHVSLSHPQYPYYGFGYRDGRLFSKPLRPDAEEMFPPKIVLNGNVNFDDNGINADVNDLWNYSYRHQLSFEIDVTDAVKYLGELTDPDQGEASEYIGKTIVAIPPHFPPAFPCAIKVGEKTYFDYILLRTQEILDDGTYIVNNSEQGISIFELRLNLKNACKIEYKVRALNPTNHEMLKYLQFINDLSIFKDLHVYLLSENRDLLAGQLENSSIDSKVVKAKLDYYDRICSVEDYYNVSLNTNQKLEQKDYELLYWISSLIKSDCVKGTWKEATVKCIVSPESRENLKSTGNATYSFAYVGKRKIELMGSNFVVESVQVFKNARIANYDKTVMLADLLENGETLKITIEAVDDDAYEETLNIPDKMKAF